MKSQIESLEFECGLLHGIMLNDLIDVVRIKWYLSVLCRYFYRRNITTTTLQFLLCLSPFVDFRLTITITLNPILRDLKNPTSLLKLQVSINTMRKKTFFSVFPI